MTTAHPPHRVLLGPGPSSVHPRVLAAMARPMIGHLDPAFIQMMEETKQLLRATFLTENRLTLPISATGSAGMEACLVNLLEPGDTAIIGVNGVFGTRMVDIVERCGATPVAIEAPWGRIIEPGMVNVALGQYPHAKLVALVHAETSTGAWQPLEEIGRMVRDADSLLVVDTVTSLGGCPVRVDEWLIDAAYSGTQKCLSCPPGMSPVTFGPRAVEALHRRTHKVQSWYLDLTMIEKYWGDERVYHHTAPISMNYALLEALRLVHEEGLEARWARHQRHHQGLKAGLAAIGLPLASQEGHQLWALNSVAIPDGVDDMAVRGRLLNEFNLEIGGGLGPLKGKVWRIGLMGESSTAANVLFVLHALERVLPECGYAVRPGAAVEAASRALAG
ncbi:MAG: alanine--glyoxylate aminotransferase family protein [Deltaproteobacteria bacterium]|nr:alanine--glyoxylate aminotransferase family protein [Deltaproteobacteria bacterium]